MCYIVGGASSFSPSTTAIKRSNGSNVEIHSKVSSRSTLGGPRRRKRSRVPETYETTTYAQMSTILEAHAVLSRDTVHEEDREVAGYSLSDLLSMPFDRDTASKKIRLKSLTLKELEGVVGGLGLKPERALEICRFLYGKNFLIESFDQLSGINYGKNAFSKTFWEKLAQIATPEGGLVFDSAHVSQDGTVKLISRTEMNHLVETVIVPMEQGPQRSKRYTICVSSQVGCRQNCDFCHTGRMGLLANLQAAQIVEQVLIAKRYLSKVHDEIPITGVVFMGMGEPFDNLQSVKKAVKILTDPTMPGLRLKATRITVSTSGIIPGIRDYLTDPEIRSSLAVSLHATTNEVRDWLVPLNKRYKLEDLIQILQEFYPRTPGNRRVVTLQYVLLKGVNDSMEDANRLGAIALGINSVVNLITFNDHPGTAFKKCSREETQAFRSRVSSYGVLCTVRDSRGDEGASACGQLGDLVELEKIGRKPVPTAAARGIGHGVSPTVI